MKGRKLHTGPLAAGMAFLAAFGFFQGAYPYHLMRREQLALFVFDGDYIRQTYRGGGCLVRLLSDFLEQFFRLPVAGPLLVALLLTGIGWAVYRISRHFLGHGPSLVVAALFFVWSFLRETSNVYITRYTLAVLAYLALLLTALQFRGRWQQAAAALLLLGGGAWAIGAPFHPQYGKLWSVPKFPDERMIGLDVETARENWDKVLELSKVDLRMEEASYCYNLAHAMKGDLGDALLNHSQNHHYTLLFPVSSERTIFTNCLAGEAWFQLGDMTLAEQSAVTSLQASPQHTGARFLLRLAQVNLITGEDAAAQKYLTLLDKTLFYGKWARSMMPGNQDDATRKALEGKRALLARNDFVHSAGDPAQVLRGLLEAHPGNRPARDYLLCLDLMSYNLDAFMEDYRPWPTAARLYHEACLIWLSQHGILDPEHVAGLGVDVSTVDRMGRFGRNPSLFKNSYWYYYLEAMNAQ